MEKARADQWMKLHRFDIGACVYRSASDTGRDVRRRTLMVKDDPQGPRDDKSAGEITLDGRERVRSRGGLQEEPGKTRGVSELDIEHPNSKLTRRGRRRPWSRPRGGA